MPVGTASIATIRACATSQPYVSMLSIADLPVLVASTRAVRKFIGLPFSFDMPHHCLHLSLDDRVHVEVRRFLHLRLGWRHRSRFSGRHRLRGRERFRIPICDSLHSEHSFSSWAARHRGPLHLAM